MWMLILNVVYVLVAIAIIALVLMQRGSGAQAGSGFGAGASGTVFGARGASNFLSKSTKWLAIAFFGISLFMAWYATHSARPAAQQNLGVMSQLPAAPQAPVGELPKPSTVPSTPIQPTPAAPAGAAPAAPQQAAPAGEQAPVTPPQGG
ncbi:preprotein translocase subunit SecG [Pseudoxanthomonas sp. F37]|jgi:preprotein translocase subunit SecG|uniref:preprotein translocase subunit SecG n=1 Tax=Pseudoxanthomonas TaxID=83618 RepID=UPI001FD40BC2|nr:MULTISPECIES: preprotein translocase subunit SecG [Pseudoxanthomonas]UOV05016.1 preprotein translocase subunit SecG [Pseudoxanthomonas mexicana]UOV10022.1 preprotein translocase subunit SecG [Pseudoxanthomonas sp. F37]